LDHGLSRTFSPTWRASSKGGQAEAGGSDLQKFPAIQSYSIRRIELAATIGGITFIAFRHGFLIGVLVRSPYRS
jgi:hypothetical protein